MTTPLVFFSLEFNRLDDDHLTRLLAANADLARYKPVFRPDARDAAAPAFGRAGEVPA